MPLHSIQHVNLQNMHYICKNMQLYAKKNAFNMHQLECA